MKKYVSTFVCLCLLIAALFFHPDLFNGRQIVAGKGDGKNEKIETIADVEQLLDSFSKRNKESLKKDFPGGTILLSNDESQAFSDDADESNESDEEIAYNSFTVTETAYLSVMSKYGSSSMNRILTMYTAQNATYYHSVGEMSNYQNRATSLEADAPTERVGQSMAFDMEVFIDYTNVKAYIKINSFDMIGQNKITFSNEAMGRWISFGEGDELLFDVDQMNQSFFPRLAKVVDVAIEKDLFDHSRSEYVLKDKDFFDAADVDQRQANLMGECVVNLSDKEAPIFMMEMNAGESYMDLAYTFENINNTVVEFPANINVLQINEENIDSYLTVEDMEG